jgi:hypothetical protein
VNECLRGVYTGKHVWMDYSMVYRIQGPTVCAMCGAIRSTDRSE